MQHGAEISEVNKLYDCLTKVEEMSKIHYSDAPISVDDVAKMISDYNDNRDHNVNSPLVVSRLTSIDEAIASTRERVGVYIHYRSDNTLIYIGKSEANVADRLNAHNRASERASAFWSLRPAAFVQTILVERASEAPELEEFLIKQAQMLAAQRGGSQSS